MAAVRTSVRLGAIVVPALLAGCAPDFAASPTAERSAPTLAATTPTFDDQVFEASDGARLPLTVSLPVDEDGQPAPVRAVIVALHGFNDRKAAFDLPEKVWRRHGIATYAYDQRGFGSNPDPGFWPGSRTLAQDLADAVRAARRRHPGVPVCVVGESMGGAVAVDAAAGTTGAEPAHPDGIVLVAPAVWGRDSETVPERLALWFAAHVIPAARFTGEGLGVLASNNIPMLRELGRDPTFIKETRSDAIFGLVNLMDEAVHAAPRLKGPVLLLYGAHDEVIPKDSMREFIGELPGLRSGLQRVAYYREGWHMLLRDLEGPAVALDVVRWIDDHAAALPSGADSAAASLAKEPAQPLSRTAGEGGERQPAG